MKVELVAQRRIRGSKWHALVKLARLLYVYKNTGIALSFPCFEKETFNVGTGVILHLNEQSLEKISYHDLYDLCDHESRNLSPQSLDETLDHVLYLITLLRNDFTREQISKYIQHSQFVVVLTMDGGKMASILYNFAHDLSFKTNIPIPTLKYLNKHGHIWGEARNMSTEEQHKQYIHRIISRYKLLLEIEHQLMSNSNNDKDPILQFFSYKFDEMIPIHQYMDENIIKDQSMYDIKVLWAPGFYSLKNLPLSTLGITFTVSLNDIDLTFIQISPLFKKRESLSSVSRRELIVHELIHAARVPIHSNEYEEEIAYRLSSSMIRRVLAPITRRQSDAVLFTVFSAVSIVSDLPQFPRWFTIFSKFPVLFTIFFSLYRLFSMKRKLKRTLAYLKRHVPERHVLPIIFRLTDQEITQLASTTEPFSHFVKQRQNDMRWKVIQSCYLLT
jgi:hypothetical protein